MVPNGWSHAHRPVLADGYEFDYNLNVRAEAAAVETTAAAPDANM